MRGYLSLKWKCLSGEEALVCYPINISWTQLKKLKTSPFLFPLELFSSASVLTSRAMFQPVYLLSSLLPTSFHWTRKHFFFPHNVALEHYHISFPDAFFLLTMPGLFWLAYEVWLHAFITFLFGLLIRSIISQNDNKLVSCGKHIQS